MGAFRRTFPMLLAGAACAASFLPGVGNTFFADDRFLVLTRLVSDRQPLDFFHQDYWYPLLYTGLYRPFGLLFLYAERLCFGLDTIPYHLVGLLLHFAGCCIAWRLLRPVLGPFASVWSMLLFAVHPIHTEAVLTVYGQLDLLSTDLLLLGLFALGGIGCRNTRKNPEQKGHRMSVARTIAFTIGFTSILAAMLTKESAFVAPLLLLLLHFAQRRPEGFPWFPLAIATLPIPLVAISRYVALGRLTVPIELTVIGQGGLAQHAKAVVISLAHAVRLCLFPTGQTIYYGHLRDSLFGSVRQEVVWLFSAACAALLLLRWLPPRRVWFCIGWFTLSLIPVSNLVPIGVLIAERALYLPSLGTAAIGAIALASLHVWFRRFRVPRQFPLVAVTALGGVAVIGFALALVRVSLNWRTEESLWRFTVENHPSSPRAHALLGLALLDQRPLTRENLTEARSCFDRALELNPLSVEALFGMGRILMEEKNYASALPYMEKAVTLRPSATEMIAALDACRQHLASH